MSSHELLSTGNPYLDFLRAWRYSVFRGYWPTVVEKDLYPWDEYTPAYVEYSTWMSCLVQEELGTVGLKYLCKRHYSEMRNVFFSDGKDWINQTPNMKLPLERVDWSEYE